MPKIAIIVYSTWGHLFEFAKHVQAGVESAGGKADIFRVPETLSEEVLLKMNAPAPPADIPVASMDTLLEYDAFLFGIPTRFGTLPSQFFEFFGQSSQLWSNASLYHKPAGVFVSTGSLGGGQETTVRNFISILAHHGMIFVPLGYTTAFPLLTNLDEVHGSSAWGAGLFAGGDGSRVASELETNIAKTQGSEFFKVVTEKFNFDNKSENSTAAAATDETSSSSLTDAKKEISTSTEKPLAEKPSAEKPVKKEQEGRSAQTAKKDKKDFIDISCSLDCTIV